MTEQRFALLVASYCYEDPGLSQLVAPAEDAAALARVLADPTIGGFDVQTVINKPSHVVTRAVEEFFTNRRLEDILLFYFSGHGLKDEQGRLFFAMANTERKLLGATALPAVFVNEVMDQSRSRRNVLLLDCCYSGAFAAGRSVKGDPAIHTPERFRSKGRVVLTASDAMQYSFEGDMVSGRGVQSIFTRLMVDGLKTGDADRDGDGLVDQDELYAYIDDRIRKEMSQQRPGKWQWDVQGRIVIARSPKPRPPNGLPLELWEALASPFSGIRHGAVVELGQLLSSHDPTVTAAARATLYGLLGDESQTVAQTAAKILSSIDSQTASGRHAQDQTARDSESHAVPGRQSGADAAAQQRAKDKTQREYKRKLGAQDKTPEHGANQKNVGVLSTTDQADVEEPSGAHLNRWMLWAVTAGVMAIILVMAVLSRTKEFTSTNGDQGVTSSSRPDAVVPNRIAATIKVGDVPRSMVSTDDAIWVANQFSNTVSRIDPVRNRVVATIGVGKEPIRIATTMGAVWVVNSHSSTVSRIDPSKNRVVATIRVGVGPIRIATTAGAIWVSNDLSRTVSRIDPVRNRVIATIKVGERPEEILASERSVWVANILDNTVSRIDPVQNRVVATINVGRRPSEIVAAKGTLWVINSFENSMSRIDPTHNRVVATIKRVGTFAAVVNKHAIWTSDPIAGIVYRIDPLRDRVIATIKIGKDAWWMAADANAVWAVRSDSSTVSRIDPARNRVVATIKVGANPEAILADTRAVWVTNTDDDTVSRVHR